MSHLYETGLEDGAMFDEAVFDEALNLSLASHGTAQPYGLPAITPPHSHLELPNVLSPTLFLYTSKLPRN